MAILDLIPFRRANALAQCDDGLDPFAGFHRHMNSLLNEFFHGSSLAPSRCAGGETPLFQPDIDVVESDKDIRVIADLPGMDEKDIEVELTEAGLSLHGEKKQQSEENRSGYRCVERSYGSFRRFVQLPQEIDREHVTADFKKGVLTVTVPKTEQAAAKRVKVEVKP